MRLQRQLGAGSSGEVWEVECPGDPANEGSSAGRLALKIGKRELCRFLASEMERLTMACSVALPVPKDVGRLPSDGVPRAWSGAPYLLMTRLPGRSLRQVIGDERDAEAWLTLATAVARDIGAALADLHEAGVAHGDVKPDNILVQPSDDEAGWNCTLCDLGLAVVGEQSLGGTPKYLPPEVREPTLGPSSPHSRDLWALGITLLEVLHVQGEHIDDVGTAALPTTLRAIVAGLLARSAGARPRARWISRTAGARESREERMLAIKRCYLAAHSDFLDRVRHGAPFQVSFGGRAGAWLTEAAELLRRIPPLLQDPEAPTDLPLVVAEPLPAERRNRFLVSLCGLTAVDFPQPPDLPEEDFVERLVLASMSRAPEAFTFDLFTDPASLSRDGVSDGPKLAPPRLGVVELAVELGAERPDWTTVAQAETLAIAEDPPLPFRLALSRVLKRRGELGRARAVLLGRPESEARVALAGILARSGCIADAVDICNRYVDDPEPAVSAAACALIARLQLARGDVDKAAEYVSRHPNDPAVLEASASVALSRQQLPRARDLLAKADGVRCDAEQRARLHALLAHLEHQLGHHEAALRGYSDAASDARRAGAIVEEATYLVGVASTAVHVAKTNEALSALRRADLLFELIDNPAARARAALNRASALAMVGATSEALAAAGEAMTRANAVNDTRCAAWAHLTLACHGARPNAYEHLDRARALLLATTPSEQLRLEACALSLQSVASSSVPRWDEAALDCADVEVQLEWWAARSRQLIAFAPTERGAAVDIVLTALSRLLSRASPVDATAQAYAAGAELAALVGDGERSVQFLAFARDAHQKIVDGAPPDLKLSARQLPWATWMLRHSSESPLRAEQISEVERLVKDLADHSRLRPVLDRSLDALIRWTGVERGLLLMTAPGGNLVPRAARNLARQNLTTEQLELSQTLARRALETGDCVVAMDASGELPSLHHSVHALKLRSVLAVPLIARGDTLGVVYLDDRLRRGAFGSSELAWVRLVGAIAAVAIAEARDQALLRRSARRATRAEKRLATHLDAAKVQLNTAQAQLSNVQSVLAQQSPVGRHGLIGSSPPMLALYHLIDRVGPSPIPVLIFGESGTGKELVARALHRASSRHDRAFISENCSAIPGPLLESILFGHKKGSFTGAVNNHIGLFETADGGTLFLDELGEMSLPMQAKLLRVLETGELRRVGDDKVSKVDVRILGASHRNLEQMVEQGLFREDLYYRLNVITVRLPPLRERASDIPDLVQHFLRTARKGRPMPIEPAALAALQVHTWPGNVRQLENELRRACVLADHGIALEHLSPAVGLTTAASLPPHVSKGLNLRRQVDALETQLIEQALRDAAGNQSRAAEVLGVSRFGLQKMIKRLGLTPPAK